MNKPLTIEQLKSLEVGDWVWITDNYGQCEHYTEIGNDITGGKNHLFLVDNTYSENYYYSDYGTKWLAYKNKEESEGKCNLYQIAFELILQDVYNTRLRADTMSCSSCPLMFKLFDECQNQGLYKDCKRRWQDYYLTEAKRQAGLRGEK